MNKIIQGDCLEKLKELPENSVDSIVTDPPAGISFMGREWDSDKGGRDHWIKWMQEVATECKRVLKPGGHAFVWAIPRTSHWTATAWENAGFEIRDVVAHIFGSGFPKSLNIGKAFDKLQGNEREDLGEHPQPASSAGDVMQTGLKNDARITKGTSEWEGWGTALKPAREDWILMRKPLEKGLTIAENVLKYGTGGINIDESRVEAPNEDTGRKNISDVKDTDTCGNWGMKAHDSSGRIGVGRFPANLITDGSEEVRECFPETKTGKAIRSNSGGKNFGGDNTKPVMEDLGYDDNGGNASRFFKSIIYQAKASKSERNKGCEGLEVKQTQGGGGGIGDYQDDVNSMSGKYGSEKAPAHNNHPTIKPLSLMTYLIKMVTPKGGIVLDPFAGSGSTLVAAKQNGFQYIGIEMTEEYIPIIEARLK